MFRTANPKDLKNSTFDALSFFFFLMDDRILPNVVAAGLVKLVTLSLTCTDPFNTSISYAAYTTALSPLSSYVQSDGNLFSSKVEQSSVLVYDTYR